MEKSLASVTFLIDSLNCSEVVHVGLPSTGHTSDNDSLYRTVNCVPNSSLLLAFLKVSSVSFGGVKMFNRKSMVFAPNAFLATHEYDAPSP